ncbi:MAG TPA: hypothetical protein VEJ36_02340 [Nitrososphaerales archaeon]|nr:hypothetical protein [Nitrososphaerales archaeon]
MNQGLWVWPEDAGSQRSMARRIMASNHLTTALNALVRAKDGLSNAEIDDALSDNSEWMTLWVTRQLVSLGFADYNPDLFGGPGKYRLTELGRNFMARVTVKPTMPTTQPVKQVAPVN